MRCSRKIAVDFAKGCTACTILHNQRAIPKTSRNQNQKSQLRLLVVVVYRGFFVTTTKEKIEFEKAHLNVLISSERRRKNGSENVCGLFL